jgi:hypothetical protein
MLLVNLHASHFAVKITVENEPLYVIFASPNHNPKETVTELGKNLGFLLFNDAIVYEHRLYFWDERTNTLLMGAIAQNVKPSLAPFLVKEAGR